MKIFYSKPKISHLGFTLVEVLISVVILAIASFTTYRVFENFSASGVRTQDEIVAKDIISSTFEQIKHGIEVQPATFGNLVSSNWTPVNDSSYPDGYYNQQITYTPRGDVVDALIQMQWNDQRGTQHETSNVFTLSQPSNFIFGNIVGKVQNCSVNPPEDLGEATVTISEAPAGFQWKIGAAATVDDSGNYTFQDAQERNTLPVGLGYKLKATRAGFFDAIVPADPGIDLPAAPDSEQDICMFLAEAKIKGALVDATDTKIGIPNRKVKAYRNGSERGVATTTDNGGFSITVDQFDYDDVTADACFTIATGTNNYADSPFFSRSNSPVSYFGQFCNPAFSFYKGWSSSVLGNNPSSPICSPDPSESGTTPWQGRASIEKPDSNRSVCLGLGDPDFDLGNIPLRPSTLATLTVNITVEPAVIIDPSYISVKITYNNGVEFATFTKDTVPAVIGAASPFTLTVQVPPLDQFFTDDTRKMKIRVNLKEIVGGCCGNATQTKIIWKDIEKIIDAPINSVDAMFDTPSSGVACGNAEGRVFELDTEMPYNVALTSGVGAQATTASKTYNATNISGNQWKIKCNPQKNPDPGCMIIDTYCIDVWAANHYHRSSCPIKSWPHTQTDPLKVESPTLFTKHPSTNPNMSYDVELYRRGVGNITGRVVDSNHNPWQNARVELDIYNDGVISATDPVVDPTPADGIFTFSNVVESWPPTIIDHGPNPDTAMKVGELQLPADTRSDKAKEHTVNDQKTHRVKVTLILNEGTMFEEEGTAEMASIYVENGVTTDIGDIVVTFPGGGL